VNIEAGRQHAPLDLLWKIAVPLNIEITVLIPHRSELLASESAGQLDDEMRKQIEIQANGDPALKKSLTSIVTHLRAILETDQNRGGS
jgi:hypothetical protein